jgi:sterol 3beta-glucosyltransferase
VAALGVGSGPIPQKKLNVNNLAAAIEQVTSDKQMGQRAAALGKEIEAEDGVARAIEFVGY